MVEEDPADNSANNNHSSSDDTELPLASDSQKEGEESSVEEKSPNCCCKAWNVWCRIYNKNDFIIQVVIVILLARAYPPLGAEYLYPQITSTWIAVILIFILAVLGLKTEEFKKAFQRLWFNLFVQVFNFGVVSSIVYGASRFFVSVNAIPQSLGDGMVVCACLPLTINMCLVLTKSSGGDEAAAIFNAAFGNMVGVFLSPILILAYLGVSGNVELWDVFYKLALRVVLPVAIGQVLQKCVPPVVTFFQAHKPTIKKIQQWCLVYIVYTVFCRTFARQDDSTQVSDIFIMIAIQTCLLILVMTMAWTCLGLLFRNQPELRVMGLYGCTHKTVAMGVPMINAIYEKDPLVGLYTLPLLIWHPTQLVLGSFLAPRLSKWVQSETERLESAKQQPKGPEEGEEQGKIVGTDKADDNEFQETSEC